MNDEMKPISLEEAKKQIDEYIKNHSLEQTISFCSTLEAKGDFEILLQYVGSKFSRLDFSLNCTDTANAEFFTEINQKYFKFDHRRGIWLIQRNHYLEEDKDGEVQRKAIESMRERFKACVDIQDQKQRDKVSSWCTGSENKSRIMALLSIASNLKPISDSGDNFDKDPFLFALANGVIDLRLGNYGRIRNGNSDDNITMHSNVKFDPRANCPRFIKFINQIFGYDFELIYWVWRFIGYCMTGLTREQIWVICYGNGGNGKDVLFSVLSWIMGDYYFVAPFTTFEADSQQSIPSDLAQMLNKRLITASETLPGSRLNEQRLKAFAGESSIRVRFMHHDWFEFYPVGKIMLAVNHKPKVKDDTNGFWRKVVLIPFTQIFTDNPKDEDHRKDRDLKSKLNNELSGILNWAILGALEYQKVGLADRPREINQGTESYKKESDTINLFTEDMCIQGDKEKIQVKASELYKAYKNWAIELGYKREDIETNTAFGSYISARFKKDHKRDGWYYLGLGLIDLITGVESNSKNESEHTILTDQKDVESLDYKLLYEAKCDGFVTGFETEIKFQQLVNISPASRNYKCENPSQPVTEASDPSQMSVTGQEIALNDPSRSQKLAKTGFYIDMDI